MHGQERVRRGHGVHLPVPPRPCPAGALKHGLGRTVPDCMGDIHYIVSNFHAEHGIKIGHSIMDIPEHNWEDKNPYSFIPGRPVLCESKVGAYFLECHMLRKCALLSDSISI